MSQANDELLRALALELQAEERDADTEALDALLRAELTATELERLQKRGATDPQLARAVRAHTPLDAAAQARIADALVGALRPAKQPADDAKPASSAPDAPVALDVARQRHAAKRPGSSSAVWKLAPVLAIAAAALLWLGRPQPRALELPEYGIELHAADETFRSGDQDPGELGRQPELGPVAHGNRVGPISVGPHTRLVCQVRPERAVKVRIHAQAYLALANHVQVWPSSPQVSEQGAVRIELEPAPASFFDAQRARLIVVVASDASELEAHADLDAVGSDRGVGWQRWIVPLTAARVPAAP